MKPLSELRATLSFFPQEINSSISFFAENCNIDFDVYLPNRGMNLQRDFVWDLHQKRELIWSILMKRNIPRMALINVISDLSDTKGTYQVIDGKQRLSTMIDFYNNKFTLEIDGSGFLFKGLPAEYQKAISGYMFSYYIVNEDYGKKISDEEKISWFRFINYAGTPQDLNHLQQLTTTNNLNNGN